MLKYSVGNEVTLLARSPAGKSKRLKLLCSCSYCSASGHLLFCGRARESREHGDHFPRPGLALCSLDIWSSFCM